MGLLLGCNAAEMDHPDRDQFLDWRSFLGFNRDMDNKFNIMKFYIISAS